MAELAPIKYMGFWDVPLIFVVRHKEDFFLFDCEFDEETEDQRDFYKVYLLPPNLDVDKLDKDWTKLRLLSTRFLGEIPVNQVQFDPTHRREVDASVLERFAVPSSATK